MYTALHISIGLPLFLAIATPVASAQSPPFEFTENGAARGIGPYSMTPGQGGGFAAADYDQGDGDIDLYVPTTAAVSNQLYRNLGNGQYEEIAALVGLDQLTPDRAALWVDLEGDGDLDLFVARDICGLPCTEDLLRLYQQNSDGTFTEVTAAFGLSGAIPYTEGADVGGLAAADLDRDGDVDLYVSYWEGGTYLFRNEGGTGFTEVSLASGVSTFEPTWQPTIGDLDGDHWPDILQPVDFIANRIFRGDGDGTFTDVAGAAGAANAMNDMGSALGDLDNDGDLDLYITAATQANEHNVLFRNDSVVGSLAFVEVAEAAGCASGGWGWGTTLLDADRDGWLDIAATNGAYGPWSNDASVFYRNLSGPAMGFEDVSGAVGFADTFWGSALASFDHDRDGDLDIVQTCAGGPLRLLENAPGASTAAHHWLRVHPRGSGANSRAIGAVVRVVTGGLEQMRSITAGTSYLCQEPAEAFFGLGPLEIVDEITVEWPGGGQTTLGPFPVDQAITITEGPGPAFVRGDCNGDFAVDVADPIALLTHLFLGGLAACADGCDGNDDGTLDVADAIALLGALFSGETLPSPLSCGTDPEIDTLGCPESPCP